MFSQYFHYPPPKGSVIELIKLRMYTINVMLAEEKVFSLILTAREQIPNLILFQFNRNKYKNQDESNNS